MRSKTLTMVLVNMAAIMERADEALLPGVYKEVGAAMNIDPTGLGSLTLVRSIVQSSCYPLAAYLAIRHNRAHVIALGALLWAAATFLVAISSTFFQMAISRGLNGIGLAIVVPAIQSLVADSTDDKNRGMAFGWLQLTGNIGTILGGMFAVLLASTSFMGIPGWRIAFHLIGLLSAVVGILVGIFANDPRFPANVNKLENHSTYSSIWSELKDLFKEAKSVITIPSFQIIVAQGVAGTFAWSSMAFTTMWLELIGFSHEQTAFLTTTFAVAVSLGGLFGGRMGDIFAQRFPNAGRVALAQISSGLAIPLATIWLLVLPHSPSSFLYGSVMFIMGFCISWNAPATNNPIFAEIVPERSRTSIYALDRCFESILSSFAPPAVGLLAQQVYGYKPIPRGVSESLDNETDRGNATSLAKAMYTSISITKAVGFIIYSMLHRTYPRDRERARIQAIRESEMKMIQLDTPLREDHSQIHVSESEMLYNLNNDDEKYLLLNRKRKSEQ